MRHLMLLVLLALPVAAFAQQQPKGEAVLFIGEEVCDWATSHVPDADVAYQPGVDAEGNQVAPAETPALSLAQQQQQDINNRLLRQMTLVLTSDIAKQLGIPEKLVRQQLNVGTVEMDELGRPTINGVLLENPDPSVWQTACDQSVRKQNTPF